MSHPYANDDLLWRQLKTIPAFRAILRAVEGRFYHQIEFPSPTLDLGCGDGHFVQMVFDRQIEVGIDPWWNPLKKSLKADVYKHVLQGLGDDMPFPDEHFASAFSNSVLEHIPNIQPVLNETSRVMQTNGRFLITMPSHNFTKNLGGAAFFESLGLSSLADKYREFFNFISRHEHTDSVEVWGERLAKAGFRIERWEYYFSTPALRALEMGHVQGLPSAIMHLLTGRWIIAPWKDSLQRVDKWLRKYYLEEAAEDGAYLLIIAQKVANHPITVNIPEAQPFTVAELEAREHEWLMAQRTDDGNTPPPPPPVTAPTINQPETESPFSNLFSSIQIGPRLLTGILLVMALLLTARGIYIFNTDLIEPASGLRSLVWGVFFLGLLAWQQGEWTISAPSIALPSLQNIPAKRWLYFLSLPIAFIAYGRAQAQQGNLALLLWLVAIGVAWYALHKVTVAEEEAGENGRSPPLFPMLPNFVIPLALAVLALAVRYYALGAHPFILNGTEASLGLDASRIADGAYNNPFGTGWLTNPTLPLYFLAIPLRIFGNTTFALRFLSPIIGAGTVLLVYYFGKQLWSEAVGLVSAILLIGMHFHLHYSRLGVTNIWDPMLTLLAVGLLGMAWQKQERVWWLAGGTAVGLTAYAYTSSHLVPLMLVGLAVLGLLLQRAEVWARKKEIALTALLALTVALPQMLYYNANETLFMERANVLGIYQNGWLEREALQTGLSEGELVRQQLATALMGFVGGSDTSPSYRPQTALLNFGMALLFMVGLGLSLLRLREWKHTLLVVWVLTAVIFAGALLESPPNSHRLVIATPAIALLAGFALTHIATLLTTTHTDENRTLTMQTVLVMGFLAILLAGVDLFFYFGQYRNQVTFADRNTEIADSVGHYLQELDGDEWVVYFYGAPNMFIGFPNIPFLAEEFRANQNLFDVFEDGQLQPSTAPNKAYLFLPERYGELPTVQEQFANGEIKTVNGRYASPLIYIYEVTE